MFYKLHLDSMFDKLHLRFVKNTRSWLVLIFVDLEVNKIGKWSEISTFISISVLLPKELVRIWSIIVALWFVTCVSLFIIGVKLREKAVLN